jgi:probable F420-dependent oxidoreductase
LRFGVYLYPPGGSCDPRDVVRLARGAESLGFDSVWLGDHVAWPRRFDPNTHGQVGGKTPPAAAVESNVLEPLTTLSFVAASVERVRLGLGVLVAPYRNPLLAAKMLASLDTLSGGRLVVGVGAGWLREEFELLGAPGYEHRGAVTDEYLQVFRELWTSAEPSFEGRFAHISGVVLNPKPVQRPHPPLWVGGNGAAGMRRAARFGDAWMPLHQSPAALAAMVPRFRELVEAGGRDPAAVGVAVGCRFHLSDDGSASAGGGTLVGGAAELVDRLHRYREAGVEEVNLISEGYADVDQLLDAWDRFANAVAVEA